MTEFTDGYGILRLPPSKAALLPFPPGTKVVHITNQPEATLGNVESAYIDLSHSNRETKYMINLHVDGDNEGTDNSDYQCTVAAESNLRLAPMCRSCSTDDTTLALMKERVVDLEGRLETAADDGQQAKARITELETDKALLQEEVMNLLERVRKLQKARRGRRGGKRERDGKKKKATYHTSGEM